MELLFKDVSVAIPLTAKNTTPVLPSNMIVPIDVFEKDTGQDDSYYRLCHQRGFLPNATPGNELRVWAWREQQILFVGASIDKVVRVRYYRLITDLSGDNAPVELTHALNYLAYHTAALAAEHIGQNLSKAQTLESAATDKLNKLLKKEVKQSHSRPTRRLPFRLNRRIAVSR
jgi:hypothetical protein